MIRVNLLRSKTFTSEPLQSTAPDLEKVAGKNLGIIISLAAILYAYEFQNISNLKKELVKTTVQLTKLRTELQEQIKVAGEATVLAKQLDELKERVKILKNLSRTRLIELKSLDALQSILPEKVWFESIRYNNNKFDIRATAVEIEDITSFKLALDGQVTFKNVAIKDTREISNKSGGAVNQFNLSFEVEEKIE
jgi:Tfp pilus assembly protein PilN